MVTSDDGIDPDPDTGRAVLFQSRQEVLDYTGGGAGAASVFPATSRVYLAADAFFRVDSNRGYPRGGLLIGRQVDAAIAGVVTGDGTQGDITAINTAIDAPGSTFLIDGVAISAAGLTALQAASLTDTTDVADAMTNAVQSFGGAYGGAVVTFANTVYVPYEPERRDASSNGDDRCRLGLVNFVRPHARIRG